MIVEDVFGVKWIIFVLVFWCWFLLVIVIDNVKLWVFLFFKIIVGYFIVNLDLMLLLIYFIVVFFL